MGESTNTDVSFPVVARVARALRARAYASPATVTDACPCAERPGHLVASSSHLQPSALRLSPSGAPRQRRAGFTLLELMIVITMMIFITTIALINYFGAMRAKGWSTVSNNVFNALLMARQRACLDNKPVYFYLLDGTNYVLQEALGTVAHIDPIDTAYPSMLGSKVFYDPYFDASAFSSNTPLIDIDRPGTGAIVWLVQAGNNMQMTNPVTLALYPIAACMLHVTNNLSCDFSHWQEGDHYGASLFAPQMLPKGFVFTPDPLTLSQTQRLVLFQADGSVDTTDYLSQLVVQEVISGKQMKFTISSNGKITQGQ